MCQTSADGKRIYTLNKVMNGAVTKSAHPARFSPDDKWSRHRVTLKRRFGTLMSDKSTFLPPSPILFPILLFCPGYLRCASAVRRAGGGGLLLTSCCLENLKAEMA